MLFAAYLIQSGRQSSTVKSYLSAVRTVLRTENVKLQEDLYLISSLTKACRLKNDRVKHRLPIQRDLLLVIVRTIKRYYEDRNQVYLSILYQSLMITAYFGLFRVGELTKGSHPVLARDIHIALNKKKILFILHSSKMHWKNSKPQQVKITSTNMSNGDKNKAIGRSRTVEERDLPCPYAILRQFLQIRGAYSDQKEPFFVFADKSPVKPQHM